MIKVTDVNGEVHDYDDANGEFETEDMTNNLVVQTAAVYAVFAAGQWLKCEKRSA